MQLIMAPNRLGMGEASDPIGVEKISTQGICPGLIGGEKFSTFSFSIKIQSTHTKRKNKLVFA